MPALVELHPEAIADAEAAARWYAERNPRIALAFAAEIDRAVQRIVEGPLLSPTHVHSTRRVLLERFPSAWCIA